MQFKIYCFAVMQCLQYKTDKQADLKKLDKLHRLFFNLMATGEDPLGRCMIIRFLVLAFVCCVLVEDRIASSCLVKCVDDG